VRARRYLHGPYPFWRVATSGGRTSGAEVTLDHDAVLDLCAMNNGVGHVAVLAHRPQALGALPTRSPSTLEARRQQAAAGDEQKSEREQQSCTADQANGERPAEMSLGKGDEGSEREPHERQNPDQAPQIVTRRRPARINSR
jgi:hypothetical protein